MGKTGGPPPHRRQMAPSCLPLEVPETGWTPFRGDGSPSPPPGARRPEGGSRPSSPCLAASGCPFGRYDVLFGSRCYCFECMDTLVGPGTSGRVQAVSNWVCFLCLPFPRSGLLRRRKKWRGWLKAFCDGESVRGGGGGRRGRATVSFLRMPSCADTCDDGAPASKQTRSSRFPLRSRLRGV